MSTVEHGSDRTCRQILVVANQTIAGQALQREIDRRAHGHDTEVFVVCPALNSRLRHWLSDEDRSRAEAHKRLLASLAALDRLGVRARGRVGDADPVQAIADALTVFRADEIIISTHPPGRSNWLEKGVVARAARLSGVPIVHVVVDLEAEAEAVRRGAGAGIPREA